MSFGKNNWRWKNETVIDFNPPGLKAVEYEPGEESDSKANYYMFAPMITGWAINSINAKIGSILKYNFMGYNVDIEISYDRENKEIVFTGDIDNNGGNLTIRFNPIEKTFSYENKVVLCSIDPETDEREYKLLYSKFNNVSIIDKKTVHTNITEGFFCTSTELIKFEGDDLEFYIGPKKK